jgi:hypothetical protein
MTLDYELILFRYNGGKMATLCSRCGAQGEKEAVDHAAVEAHRAVAGQAVEEELERLGAELNAAKVG